jgi:hypothetical protein
MEAKMTDCTDPHEMRLIHATRLQRLMQGSFQTPEFSVILKLLITMVNIIGEFTDIEQEIEAIYASVLRQASRSRDRKGHVAFIETTKEQLTEVMARVQETHAKFSGNLGEFYATCFDDSKSVDLQYVENRLYWCVLNLR